VEAAFVRRGLRFRVSANRGWRRAGGFPHQQQPWILSLECDIWYSEAQHPRSMILKPTNLKNDARCGSIWRWAVPKRSNEEAEGFTPSRPPLPCGSLSPGSPGAMDKGQSGRRWKRAEVKNGMVTIERGRTRAGLAVGGGESPLGRIGGLVPWCFILLQAKSTYLFERHKTATRSRAPLYLLTRLVPAGYEKFPVRQQLQKTPPNSSESLYKLTLQYRKENNKLSKNTRLHR
jgi:hypothetical protein